MVQKMVQKMVQEMVQKIVQSIFYPMPPKYALAFRIENPHLNIVKNIIVEYFQ